VQPVPEGAIGVFDSGVGGLSVLRHIMHDAPLASLLYFADSHHAPYGEMSEAAIVERSLAVAEWLMAFHIEALVVACNTATAAAIHALRRRYPALKLVGVEPGLKPAAETSRTHRVGILATRTTLSSDRYKALEQQIAATCNTTFFNQPCDGLAAQIERGELASAYTLALLQRYISPLLAANVDTIVLGCTHYPFVLPLIQRVLREADRTDIAIIDTGAAVSRQLCRLLWPGQSLQPLNSDTPKKLVGVTTGERSSLEQAFKTLLGCQPEVIEIRQQAA
jgi:glutamate racemase